MMCEIYMSGKPSQKTEVTEKPSYNINGVTWLLAKELLSKGEIEQFLKDYQEPDNDQFVAFMPVNRGSMVAQYNPIDKRIEFVDYLF